MSTLKKKATHDYALRCRAPKDNKKDELGLHREGMKPIVLFEKKEVEVVKTPKRKANINTKSVVKLPVAETRVIPGFFYLKKSANPSPSIIPVIKDADNLPVTTIPDTSPVSTKKPCSKLDLPEVFHMLKSESFRGGMKNKDKLKLKRRVKTKNVDLSNEPTVRLDEIISKLTIGDSRSNYLRKIDFQPLDAHLDSLIAMHQTSQNDFNCDEVDSQSLASSTPGGECSVAKDTARKLMNGGLETEPWKRHAELFKTAHKAERLDSETALIITKSSLVKTKSSRQAAIAQVSTALNLDMTKLEQFEIYPTTSILESFKHYMCSNMFPDSLKHIAFSYWQKGEVDNCAYFLSEAHCRYLRTEILDKHNQAFCRADEFTSTSCKSEPKLENLKLKKFHQQSDDLIAAGKNMTSFSEHLNKLDPDWNIIQLTSMFHVHNRFSNSGVTHPETPSLFLTCFSNIPGIKGRKSFVTYVREPVPLPGISPCGIIGEFKKVMLKNRTINEKYTGDRKKYWEVRKEHNSALECVMTSVQENWLSPWYFLLPGNVTDRETRKQIHAFLLAVELALSKRLESSQRLAFYKLVENYSYLTQTIRDNVLLDLVAYILEVPKEKVKKITKKVIEIGSAISHDADRHPTILILDQSIEQLPWDWMQCLRTTNVTRVHSISVMYSLMNLVKTLPPVDPNVATYVLNPDGSLKMVQDRLERYFTARSTWNGYAGAGSKPTHRDIDSALQNKSVFLFCGHGSGQCLFPEYLLQRIYCRAIPVLMGCGSAQYTYFGTKAGAASVINSYMIAACPSVVGFLWEVTDVECDRVTVELLESWCPGKGQIPAMASFDSTSKRPQVASLATAVRYSRKAATQFLTEAAIVNYGLPIQRIL